MDLSDDDLQLAQRLLDQLSNEWRKAARVIAHALESTPRLEGVTDADYFAVLLQLVAMDKVDGRGSESDMKCFEVRRRH